MYSKTPQVRARALAPLVSDSPALGPRCRARTEAGLVQCAASLFTASCTQGISLAKPVFTGEDEYVIGAEAEPKVATRVSEAHSTSSPDSFTLCSGKDAGSCQAYVCTAPMS